MTDESATPAERRMWRWIKIALVVSIAFNLFLAAILGVGLYRRHAESRLAEQAAVGTESGAPTARALARALAVLPPADAVLLSDAVARHRRELAVAAFAFARAMRETRAALAADPVDADRLRAALEEARRRREAFGPILEEILLDAAPKMSAEGRATLAQLERRRP
mgnify:CR=1 FL=1